MNHEDAEDTKVFNSIGAGPVSWRSTPIVATLVFLGILRVFVVDLAGFRAPI
jgi:hypothetical protein